MLLPITHMMSVVTSVIIHSDTLNFALYTAPVWQKR